MTAWLTYLRVTEERVFMGSPSSEPKPVETFRCKVCGREFADQDALDHHVRDQGLLS